MEKEERGKEGGGGDNHASNPWTPLCCTGRGAYTRGLEVHDGEDGAGGETTHTQTHSHTHRPRTRHTAQLTLSVDGAEYSLMDLGELTLKRAYKTHQSADDDYRCSARRPGPTTRRSALGRLVSSPPPGPVPQVLSAPYHALIADVATDGPSAQRDVGRYLSAAATTASTATAVFMDHQRPERVTPGSRQKQTNVTHHSALNTLRALATATQPSKIS
ncbi:hypothetical protein L1887_52089 [Cichorium endivia]|nr:hypothetical protein L1887_52089 [Cichorium endivia]